MHLLFCTGAGNAVECGWWNHSPYGRIQDRDNGRVAEAEEKLGGIAEGVAWRSRRDEKR
jgi:hypothetical protein